MACQGGSSGLTQTTLRAEFEGAIALKSATLAARGLVEVALQLRVGAPYQFAQVGVCSFGAAHNLSILVSFEGEGGIALHATNVCVEQLALAQRNPIKVRNFVLLHHCKCSNLTAIWAPIRYQPSGVVSSLGAEEDHGEVFAGCFWPACEGFPDDPDYWI